MSAIVKPAAATNVTTLKLKIVTAFVKVRKNGNCHVKKAISAIHATKSSTPCRRRIPRADAISAGWPEPGALPVDAGVTRLLIRMRLVTPRLPCRPRRSG